MFTNPYSSTYSGLNYGKNTGDMASTFPALFNLINNTKNMTTMGNEPQPTPIEEIQVLLTNLPIEQRQAIENSQEYVELKSEIFQQRKFIMKWIIPKRLHMLIFSGIR